MKLLKGWLVYFFLTTSFLSCSLPRIQLDEVSIVDLEYRIAAKRSVSSEKVTPPISAVYRNGLGLVLGTDCRWMPSDSEYALFKFHECGAFISTVKTFSRYLSEFDAYLISDGVVNIEDRIHFVHYDDSCSIF